MCVADSCVYIVQCTCIRGNTCACSFFLGKVTALGVLCYFALFVCLTLLASFFFPSHLSFKNMYMYMYIHIYMLEMHSEFHVLN